MRVLFPLVAFVGAAFAQAAAKMSSTAIPKIKPQPIQPDQLIAPDYKSPQVKAFSIRLPGWGYMAAGHNNPVRRRVEEEVVVEAARQGLAPVEYVRKVNNLIIDATGNGHVYGQVGGALYYPFNQLGLIFSDSQGNNLGVPNNGLVYNVASEGVRTVGIVSGVNGPDWPYPKFSFKRVQHFNESNDLIITFAYKTKGWNPYYYIIPPTPPPTPGPP